MIVISQLFIHLFYIKKIITYLYYFIYLFITYLYYFIYLFIIINTLYGCVLIYVGILREYDLSLLAHAYLIKVVLY